MGEPELLLVEDNPADQRIALEALKRSKWNTVLRVVADGQEALDYLHQKGKHAGAHRPDLILLDLNMPRMNGREFLEKVRQDPEFQSIPIVVLTSSSATDDVASCYRLNANSYVQKPMGLQQFFDRIHEIEDYWFGTSLRP